jgi:hypothetical protein
MSSSDSSAYVPKPKAVRREEPSVAQEKTATLQQLLDKTAIYSSFLSNQMNTEKYTGQKKEQKPKGKGKGRRKVNSRLISVNVRKASKSGGGKKGHCQA